MKQFKAFLSLILLLALLISCLSPIGVGASSATGTETDLLTSHVPEEENPAPATQEGEPSEANIPNPDTIVRVIVQLEGKPTTDVAEKTQRDTHRVKLINEHNRVFKKMARISYELIYEYTELLNGFSCDVAYGDIEKIKAIEGVTSVSIEEVFEIAQEDFVPSPGGEMTGNLDVNRDGFTGEGVVIAVLDTGLRTTHEAFQVYDSMPITETLTADDISKASVPGEYISPKIPFVYDYEGRDTDVANSKEHGTPVSAVAVGYAADDEGHVFYAGAAPGAQLVFMKVSPDGSGSASSSVYIAAFEDCYRLGVDIINYSYASAYGFTSPSEQSNLFDNIFQALREEGIIVNVAAGNSGKIITQYQSGNPGTELPDYGMVGSPSSYVGNISVASVNPDLRISDRVKIDSIGTFYITNVSLTETKRWIAHFRQKEVGVVPLLSEDKKTILYGKEEDYEGKDVTDKIVIMAYEEGNLEEQIATAARMKAVGVIFAIRSIAVEPCPKLEESREIPTISIQSLTANKLAKIPEDGVVYTFCELGTGNKTLGMASDSSWGTTPMLTIAPTLTSVGNGVESANMADDQFYGNYYGTSFATPNAAGTFACVLQMIREETSLDGQGEPLNKTGQAELARSLLESTAVIIEDERNVSYPVRRQGAGLANSAFAKDTYLYGAYITNPLQELGDDPQKTGVYTMEIELKDSGIDGRPTVYDNIGGHLLYDIPEEMDGWYRNTLTSGILYNGKPGDGIMTVKVEGEEVTSVTVPSGGTVSVEVTLTLDSSMREIYDTYFPNGSYVEGYITFATSSEEGTPVYGTHATLLAYYGDWFRVPVMESVDIFDYFGARWEFLSSGQGEGLTEEEIDAAVKESMFRNGQRFYTGLNYALGVSGDEKAKLGRNPLDPDGVPFRSEHIALSTIRSNGSRSTYQQMVLHFYLLRNVRKAILRVTDKENGSILAEKTGNYKVKSGPNGNKTTTRSMLPWNGQIGLTNQFVPSGTEVTVSIDVLIPYGEAENKVIENVWSFDMTVDYTAPVIESVSYDVQTDSLRVVARDENYLAGIYLWQKENTPIRVQAVSPEEKGATVEFLIDVSDITSDTIMLSAVDYATNESDFTVDLAALRKTAELSLSTPAGTRTEEYCIGTVVSLPEGEDYAGYEFIGWTTRTVEKETGENLPTLYGKGEEIQIDAAGLTLYALYGKGGTTYFADPIYERQSPEKIEGEWVITGYMGPVEENTAYILSDLTTYCVNDLENGNAIRGQSFFTTTQENVAFHFTYSEEDGSYFIRNSEGKYLSHIDNDLVMTDATLPLTGGWIIYPREDGCGYICQSSRSADRFLGFDPDTGEFKLFALDTDTQTDNQIPDGYVFYLSKQVDKVTCYDYYSTSIDSSDPVPTLSHTLDLTSSITVNFVVPYAKLKDYDSYYLEASIPVYEGNTPVGVQKETIDGVRNGNDHIYFKVRSLTAVQMNDMIAVALYYSKDGKAYRVVTEEYSIATYAYSQLKNEASNQLLKTLCANLLSYGAKAQLYKGYRTESLADEKLASMGLDVYVTDPETIAFQNQYKRMGDVDSPKIKWVGRSLDLRSEVTVKFVADCRSYDGNVEDLVLEIQYVNKDGETVTDQVTGPRPYTATDGIYVFDYSALTAAEFRSCLTARLYEADVQIAETITYSVDSYGCNKQDAMLSLCRALIAYADAARAFLQKPM